MESDSQEIKQIATQLLAGMLSNPHLYASMGDEGGHGQQEQELVIAAIQMAQLLIQKVQAQGGEPR